MSGSQSLYDAVDSGCLKLNLRALCPAFHGFGSLTKLVLSSNSLQQLPEVPDSAALRELRLDGNCIQQAAGVVDSEQTVSGPRLRLLDLSGNPLNDSAETIESISQVCMQLEVLSLKTPVGLDTDCLMDTQWAAALHHLPRLKTLNGKKWKRDKAKAPVRSGSTCKTASETTNGINCSQTGGNATTATTDALRAVLGTLGRHQLATLIDSMNAGVNLTKQLRKAAASSDAGSCNGVPNRKKPRLHPPSHCSDERSAERIPRSPDTATNARKQVKARKKRLN